MTTTEVPAPDDAQVAAFWEVAKRRARLSHLPGYFGPSALESITPPAWALGETPAQADEQLELVMSGARTAMTTAFSDYEAVGEPLPEVGTLGIVLDGAGAPRALLVTTDVRVLPFGEVEADAVDDLTLDADAQVVLERFEVLYRD